MAIADVTRAKKEGETTGLSRVIIDGETEQLFGATMFGIAGAEVIAVLSNYMAMGASYRYMQQASQPYLRELDKVLTRAGLYDPVLVHETKSQRFVRHVAPSDAFVSYTWQGDRMVVGQTEANASLRGSGLDARFATEVFEYLADARHEIRPICPCLRRVGATRKN